MGEGLFQPLHLLLIIAIALLVFGTSKFAAVGKGLGEGIRNFKASMKDPEAEKKKKRRRKKKKKRKRFNFLTIRCEFELARLRSLAARKPLSPFTASLARVAFEKPALPEVRPRCCNRLQCAESTAKPSLELRMLPPYPWVRP